MKLRPSLALKVRGDDLGALPGVTIPHPKYHRATREGLARLGRGRVARRRRARLRRRAAGRALPATFRGSCAHTGLGRGAGAGRPRAPRGRARARVRGHRRGAAASATPRGAPGVLWEDGAGRSVEAGRGSTSS